MIRQLIDDARALAKSRETFGPHSRTLRATVLQSDAYRILLLQRWRELMQQNHIPLAGHFLRMTQTAMFGIEISNQARLGHGVNFTHPVGIVIGGNSVVGDRVIFYGNNTLGTVDNRGYPHVEDDVIIGAGARILGPVRVGARSIVGANAVVVDDVPPDSIAAGVPAKSRPKSK